MKVHHVCLHTYAVISTIIRNHVTVLVQSFNTIYYIGVGTERPAFTFLKVVESLVFASC